MNTTNYLYGIEVEELDNKFYFEALQYKLEKGKLLYKELYLSNDNTREVQDRMFYVYQALEHTEKLIQEKG